MRVLYKFHIKLLLHYEWNYTRLYTNCLDNVYYLESFGYYYVCHNLCYVGKLHEYYSLVLLVDYIVYVCCIR